ncbi:hypothetical protein N8D56_25560 (plasmid) [Devosia sp. A8/3-2]|nr:hypothetical protein N8D56_25560 [Devosia sp. A8/3-2]
MAVIVNRHFSKNIANRGRFATARAEDSAMYRLFDGPLPRGIIQLILSLLASAFYFFIYNGRYRVQRPTIFEQFQSGSPDDFSVLYAGGLLIWIGFSIAVVITDFRNSGRWW